MVYDVVSVTGSLDLRSRCIVIHNPLILSQSHSGDQKLLDINTDSRCTPPQNPRCLRSSLLLPARPEKRCPHALSSIEAQQPHHTRTSTIRDAHPALYHFEHGREGHWLRTLAYLDVSMS